MNIEEILIKEYDFNSEETISVFDELPLWSAPFGLKLLDTIKFKRNINILDIGSGSGFPMLEVAQRFGQGSMVYGIDPWLAAKDRLKKKIKLYDISNVEIISGKAEELPFINNFFGLIISNNGINNVENQEKVLSECYRTANIGAQLVFTMNLPESMKEFYNVFETTLKEFKLTDLIAEMYSPIHKKRKPVDETLKLVEGAGFKAENIYTDTFKLRFIDGSSMFRHYFIRLAFLPSWLELIPKDKRKDFFVSLERTLNELADSLGEFSLSIPYACFDCCK